MIKKLAQFIEGYKKEAILAPSLVVLEAICELIIPLIMARIIDVGINGGAGISYIMKYGGVMLILAGISMYCGVSAAKYASYGSQGYGANLRQALFNKVQEFSFANIDKFSSASLITRMTNDVNVIQMMLAMGLRIVTRSPVLLIAALAVCFSINAKLTLVLVVIVPVMAAAVGLLMKATHKLFQRFQQKLDSLNDTVQENLISIRVVKAFVRAGYEKTKFKKANDELTEAGLKAVMRIIFMQPIMMISFNLATIGVLWFGGKMILGESLLVGELYSFVSYIFYILMSVMMLAFSLLQLTRARACAARIIEVLDTEPQIKNSGHVSRESLPDPSGKVEFKNVYFKYDTSGSGDNVLDDINFTVEPGQFTAVIGGTGVGKSSLVNLIPRFYDVTGGAVLVDGMDVREYPLEELRNRIGMVLQNNVLFSGTIRENLLWGKPDATEEEMIEAAKNAQAYDFIMSFTDGFDTFLEQGGVNVSGGQKQRLCIARAMLRNPSILILDDSTSAIDSATEALIRASFKEKLKGTTVIIIAQRISSIRYADKIIILEDDHVAAVGTHDELISSSRIYQEIYISQQEGVIK